MQENEVENAPMDSTHHSAGEARRNSTLKSTTQRRRHKEDMGDVLSSDEESDVDTNSDASESHHRSASRECSVTPTLPGRREIHVDLKKKLDAMTVQQRRLEMARLGQISQYEFDRENNIARNKAMLEALEICQVKEGLFGPMIRPIFG